jgi:tetratricopeptide (TPR) repeat protein
MAKKGKKERNHQHQHASVAATRSQQTHVSNATTPDTEDDRVPTRWKEIGNAHHRKHDFNRAAEAYLQGYCACTQHTCVEIQATLLSNLAAVELKRKNHDKALEYCNKIIDDLKQTQNTKAYFRRAQARIALETKHSVAFLQLAEADLQHSQQLLTTDPNANRGQTKETAKTLQVVKQLLANAAKKEIKPPSVAASEQKDIVRRLLQNNATVGHQHPVEGEAFFLLEYQWYCQWAAYIQLFDNDNDDSTTNNLLQYLPDGATLPPTMTTENGAVGPPGPVDNSRLLLTINNTNDTNSYTYLQQWYQPYLTAHQLPYMSDEATVPVRPNLVRGYHYELLPRDVYSAICSWYTQLTPYICRRTTTVALELLNATTTTRQVVLPLYPIAPHAPTTEPLTRCACCRALQPKHKCDCRVARYCNRKCQEAHWKYHRHECLRLKQLQQEQEEDDDDGVDKYQHADGKVGLNNLGNTCFMVGFYIEKERDRLCFFRGV